MSRPTPVAEVVRSDAGWFARIRGANGHKVWQTESLTREAAALNALRVLGDLFGVGKARVDSHWLHVPTHEGEGMVGWLAIPLRNVDERGQ